MKELVLKRLKKNQIEIQIKMTIRIKTLIATKLNAISMEKKEACVSKNTFIDASCDGRCIDRMVLFLCNGDRNWLWLRWLLNFLYFQQIGLSGWS